MGNDRPPAKRWYWFATFRQDARAKADAWKEIAPWYGRLLRRIQSAFSISEDAAISLTGWAVIIALVLGYLAYTAMD